MKKIILSDHVTEAVDKMYGEREARNASKMDNYQNELRERQDKIDQERNLLKQAWKERRLLQVVGHVFDCLGAMMESKPCAPILEGPDDKERKYLSGREGELKLDEFLGSLLGDKWTVLAGYRNIKGEIDRILVGPLGIFAIEIKNINGLVSCDGDVWTRDKYDRYGNLKESNVLIIDGKEDGRRRCPGKQLNEPADVLERYLGRMFPNCRICRIVVFTHERATLGTIQNSPVDQVVHISSWKPESTFAKSSFRLTECDAQKVVRKIEDSHRYMEGVLRNHEGASEDAA